MSKKVEISICLGSSCFSRGNKEILQIIKKYLDDNHLTHRVNFHGAHCFDRCSEGPSVKINDTIYDHVDKSNVITILQENFADLI